MFSARKALWSNRHAAILFVSDDVVIIHFVIGYLACLVGCGTEHFTAGNEVYRDRCHLSFLKLISKNCFPSLFYRIEILFLFIGTIVFALTTFWSDFFTCGKARIHEIKQAVVPLLFSILKQAAVPLLL